MSEKGIGRLARRLDQLYEFDREPVEASRLHGGGRFAALFAGEHVAATEFVIGALFVRKGVSAPDLILGLLLGNLLAVLSWTFVCAPIAVRVRMTLYWYLRKIAGPGLTVIYNIANAFMYCILAGAMISVSTSAVSIAFKIPHPGAEAIMPPNVGWVLVALLVGGVVTTLAILGFKKISQFSSACAPWMFLVFIAGAFAVIRSPNLAPGGIHTFGAFWRVAKTKIWNGVPSPLEDRTFRCDVEIGAEAEPTGERPGTGGTWSPPLGLWFTAPSAEDARRLAGKGVLPEGKGVWIVGVEPGSPADRAGLRPGPIVRKVSGREVSVADFEKTIASEGAGAVLAFEGLEAEEKLGFWHIVFFAWFCNLAMHIGLSDLALFRYARHWAYGLYSAFGMYLGHYLAWICSGVMVAAIGRDMNPGQMAYGAAGLAGAIAVVIAGWTTANPTMYRAGLALQIATPNWARWKVTLVAGIATSILAVFPLFFMKLLDFVAIYGLVLMPIGAIVFAEHWLFPRLGLRRYWAQERGSLFNVPALATWAVVLLVAFPTKDLFGFPLLLDAFGMHLFFRWLPCYFLALVLYAALSAAMGARGGPRPEGA